MNPATASPNGMPTDHFGMHGQNHAFHIQQQPREQWPQIAPGPQNQPQQLHGAPWQQSVSNPMPQMQPQNYPNSPQYYQNQSSLPFDLSTLPQQIVQDFLRLSTPVGSSSNDDTILSQALSDSKQAGKTYRQALEGLHGVNNHAANLWKDYYLDHHDRIDLLVSRLVEQPKTVKKPFVMTGSTPHPREQSTSHQVARKRHSSPTPLPSPPRQPLKKKPGSSTPSQAPQRKRFTPPTATATSMLSRPPKRPRATFNSLSAPLPSNDVPNLMPPQVHIPIPDPPSRSPSPPAVVQLGTNGYKYTKEDREFFLKFLVWRLKENPSLTKKELCELLYDKAPHHSVSSWASHWHQRHDIADKILATYHTKSESHGEGNEDDQNEQEEVEVEEEMKDDEYDEASATENSRDDLGDEGFFSFISPGIDTDDDEADMGAPGSAFSRGDWCILARFVARSGWNEMSKKERWEKFIDAYGNTTKRSGKAWAEFFRKNEAAILRLSRKYSTGRSGNKSQRGHP